MNFLKLLYPGMHIKRWLLLFMLGVVIISLGFAYILRQVYIYYTFPNFVWYITLQFIPRYIRGALFIGAGVACIVVGIWRIYGALISALLPAGKEDSLINIIYNTQFLKRGPKVVAIGGGTGLSTLLRGLKDYTGNLSAIVTVADDGGSSGRLRRELGVPPPGDFRNCISALADAEPLMTRLFQYRFGEGSGLEGHSFGNLFIVAMSGVVGNFEEAIRESSRVLAVRGRILPSTLANVTLYARMEDEATVQGESKITQSGNRIKQVYIEPQNAQAYSEAIDALMEADLIILGPGSLYTSVLPNLLVDGIAKAIAASPALKVYVCNVATQRGETDGFTVADHVEAIRQHVGNRIVDYVLVNSNVQTPLPEEWQVSVVYPDGQGWEGVDLVMGDTVDEGNRLRHDSKKLASSLMKLYYEKRQRNGWRPGWPSLVNHR